jgi:hypothetical protein
MEAEIIKLPDWFEGQVYTEGGIVTNPFSGQEYHLTNLELSMYDFIIGCNMLYELRGSVSDKLIADMQKGMSWFGENNPEAFYVLLD